MKKTQRILTLLLAGSLLFSCLSGCKKQANGEDGITATTDTHTSLETKPENQSSTVPLETTYAVNLETTQLPVTTEEVIPKGALTTQEQVFALLEQYDETGSRIIQFTCSQSLFDQLKEDYFNPLRVLLTKSGLDGDIYTSDSAKVISLRDVTRSDTVWVECDTEAAVKQAILRFREEKQEAFTLICPAELATALRDTGKLFNFAAQSGYLDVRYWVSGRLIEVSDCVVFDEPYVVVENASQFDAAVEAFAQQNRTSFYIVYEQKFREFLKENPLSSTIMITGSLLHEYNRTSLGSGSYHYTNVVYAKDPKAICYTEDDVITAIRQMGALGATEFQLYLVGDLIEPLCNNSFQRLHELEAKAGMSNSQMRYSSSTTLRELEYSEAKIVADVVPLNTVADAVSYVNQKLQSGATEITLFCSKSLYCDLVGMLDNPFNFTPDGMTPIYDLISHAGIYDYDLTFSRNSYAITIFIKSLYPGTEIILAVKNGNESALSSELRKTLNAARKMASSCNASDPMMTAKNIHDALCSSIRYEANEERGKNDTAIGALLNGVADCDGYSDAFYLVGTLAGLNVRYQHGNGINSDLYGFLDTATHMWNLLELDGQWRMVDVTWDDSGDEILYTWFNIGNDRASRSHYWNEEMTVPLLLKTDLTERPENEFAVSNLSELEVAVNTAFSNGYSTFSIIFSSESDLKEQDALTQIQEQFGYSFSYSWNSKMLILFVYVQ